MLEDLSVPDRLPASSDLEQSRVRPQLNIMQLVSAPTTSGPSVHVLELSKQLRRIGHQVTIVARPGSWIAGQAKELQFDLIESHQHRFPPNEILRLGRELNRRNIDLIHTHMSRAHLMGVLLQYWCNVPCVATAHNQKMQLHWPFNRFVVSTSKSTERFQRRLNAVRASKMETIYCPLRKSNRPISYRLLQRVRRQFGDRNPERPEKLIGVVGEISYEKGHQFLIQAFEKIHRQDPSTRLVVVGNNREDYVKQMRKFADSLGLGEKISWAGYRSDIEYVMAAFDVYVCPSLRESLPLTVLEAMAAGRPIVSTNVGGLPEIMVDQDTGLVIEPKDSEAIATSVLKILGSPALASRLGQNALKVTEEQFQCERQTEKIEQLYFRLTKAGSPSDARRFQRRNLARSKSSLKVSGQQDTRNAASKKNSRAA